MQFIQGNSNLSLSLSGSNGLTLTGGLAKVLSLPTYSLLQLDGVSLKSGTYIKNVIKSYRVSKARQEADVVIKQVSDSAGGLTIE